MPIVRTVCAAIVCGLLPLILPPDARAQDGSGPGVGVLGMITRNSARADGLNEFFDNRTGWGAGLWFGGNKDGLFGLTGEVIYLDRTIDHVVGEYRTKAIEVPLLLRLNLGSRTRSGPTLYGVAGPVVTWKLRQTVDGFEVGENFRTGDLGVVGGVGLEVVRLGIEARGNWGHRAISLDGAFAEARSFTFELLGKIRFN